MTKLADARSLRRRIDADDPFTSGHQIIKPRRQQHEIPDWALNDEEVRKVLLRSHPKLMTNATHRVRAGRWMRVIQLYFRKNYTHGQIAGELDLKYNQVAMLIRAIKRAGKGMKANGSGSIKSEKS